MEEAGGEKKKGVGMSVWPPCWPHWPQQDQAHMHTYTHICTQWHTHKDTKQPNQYVTKEGGRMMERVGDKLQKTKVNENRRKQDIWCGVLMDLNHTIRKYAWRNIHKRLSYHWKNLISHKLWCTENSSYNLKHTPEFQKTLKNLIFYKDSSSEWEKGKCCHSSLI